MVISFKSKYLYRSYECENIVLLSHQILYIEIFIDRDKLRFLTRPSVCTPFYPFADENQLNDF